jgi:Zn-dependent protease with chaperone function
VTFLNGAQLFLLAGLVFVAVGAMSSAALVRVLRGRLSQWEPRARHRLLVLLSALPTLIAFSLMLSASLPALVSLVFPHVDHCLFHGGGHAHLCFLHPPTEHMNAALLFSLALSAGYVGFRAAHGIARLLNAVRLLDTLAISSEPRADLGISVVDTRFPLCVSAGLFRPRIFCSRGLLESLTESERAIVFAHERAHVRRRDALASTLVRSFSVLHLPRVTTWLLRELDVAAEQACDEEASRIAGDRVAVASAILAVERALQCEEDRTLRPLVAAFGQQAVDRRVESLLAEPLTANALPTLSACFGLIAVLVLALSSELHHLTESVLSVIAH